MARKRLPPAPELDSLRNTQQADIEEQLILLYRERRRDGWKLVWSWADPELEECLLLWEKEEK